ncbi:recombination-associated protein RdgC [Cellvibrio sp.]|uniref:recombination-associated protein RdgC n=1 Tax=Cellvibrio sp. TaxID=1965322 RepID=UPI0039647BFD
MWFKNLRLYRLTEDWTHTPEQLNEALEAHCFNPCGSLDPVRYGFIEPLGRHGSEFIHATNGYIMICAKKQEKILPAAVINEHLEEKALAISEAESRSVSRKEKQSLKDEIIFSLLPKAFSKSSLDFAYIAPQEKLIVVNASSAKRAEDLLSKLREALGSLRCIPISAKNIPTQVMTHWLQTGNLPSGFELGEECELKAGKDERAIRCKKQDLTANEILSHINSGMFVNKVAVTWKESIHCVLDDQLAVKRLKFDDVTSEKANDRNPETKAEQFDADFAIMSGELKNFIADLLAAFGGESDPV